MNKAEDIEQLIYRELPPDRYCYIHNFIVEKDKEIERLNNIINKGIEAINVYQNEKTLSIGYQDLKRIRGILRGNEFDLKIFEEYLQELKGVDKE